ncbi:ABC-type sugar transport system, permease component [Sphaerochaeta pleomorpha str. Grapes]|uniref:ABC-type sugar transport system, permease component n=1 Tax=Sphaerochaeta pleomorpha (strain ATCC BAA-1885 / DSM 22778 / Grapes) TaxID=158190 RepID=G8QWA2_SPHPG|nr:carbohydrate ABC transporter permease [Sphaerochaeta pleomorpha]AEV29400.1 ABC-type sugar transport system, permease component [Sphaerochaeta pleomorpha str. Grapes]
MGSKRSRRVKESFSDRIFLLLIYAFLGVFCFTTVYPFWHVMMYSFSNSKAAMSGGLFFRPRNFDLLAYKMIFRTSQIFVAYRNTILRTLVGTSLSMVLSVLTAYPLSKKRLRGRSWISMLVFFTMLFNGGMIPTYLIVQAYGLIDTFWALVLPLAMNAYNMFILRNYFKTIPDSLEESAFIDGADSFTILWKIIIPVSTPALAAVTMFYGVNNWNAYLDGILYINSTSLEILQVYLRKLLASTGTLNSLSGITGLAEAASLSEESMKMATIAVSIFPVLVVYPFIQRYYTSGITAGAVKE